MKVKKVMHKGATTVTPDASLKAVAKTMRKKDIGAVPVKEKGRLIGMVTDRDIACRGLANGADMKDLTARDVMTKKIVSCGINDDIGDAMDLMKKKKIRRLAVLNGKDKLAGMLSLGDLTSSMRPKQSRRLLKAITAHHSR